MIEVDNLVKKYGELFALRGVSFQIGAGEVVGFLGPNGAGKTTTMRIVTSFIPATSGTVRVGGHDVLEDSIEARRQIGYLPETPPLYSDLTVESYLSFVAKIKGVPGGARRGRIDYAVESCGLTGVRRRVIDTLSKGYRQRVGIAQALVHDPKVLILDEPTAGLDPNQIIDIRNLIGSLAGERTIVLSTHILPEVAQLCKRVIIVNEGRIVADTPITKIPDGTSLEEFFIKTTSADYAKRAAGG